MSAAVGIAPDLSVGQHVAVFSHRWTVQGWVPCVDQAIVLDPCVFDDPDYAGDVEIQIEGVINRLFVSRACVAPVAEVAGS